MSSVVSKASVPVMHARASAEPLLSVTLHNLLKDRHEKAQVAACLVRLCVPWPLVLFSSTYAETMTPWYGTTAVLLAAQLNKKCSPKEALQHSLSAGTLCR